MFKHLINFLVNWLCLINFVYSDCLLEIPSKNAPLYTRDYGSRTVVVQPSTSDIVLDNNEVVNGYCSKNFSTFQVTDGGYEREVKDVSTLEIICQEYILKVRIPGRNEYLNVHRTPMLWCIEPTWNLFELKKNFTNCKNYMSYALGALTTFKPIILAGVCYDLDNLQLRYVNYVLQQKTSILVHQERNYPEELSSTMLSSPLGNIKHLIRFMSDEDFQSGLATKVVSNFWLRFANYRYHSLIQGQQFCNELSEFREMFDVIWWDNLRLGNWKQFIYILEERAMNSVYSLYVGTSGVVRIPSLKTKTEEVLVIETNCEQCNISNFDRTRRTIPEYIWAYVRLETGDVRVIEEFVVIGYNSPYIGYFRRNETVFCNDMCDQISWLEPIERTRMVPTLGIVFCCRPEDVQYHLTGFPKTRSKTAIALALQEDFLSPGSDYDEAVH